MPEPSNVSFNPFNHITLNQNTLANVVQNLDQLLEKFGAQEVGNAATLQFLRAYTDKLKDMIDDSTLPQSIKDMAKSFIDQHVSDLESQFATSNEVDDAVSASPTGTDISEAGIEAAEEAANEATNETTTTTSSSTSTTTNDEDGSTTTTTTTTTTTNSSDEATGVDIGEIPENPDEIGTAGPDVSEEAAAEAAEEAANEGTGGADDAMDELAAEAGQAEKNDKKGKATNWLEALAMAMSDIQSKFLDKAMAAADVMAAESDNASEGGKSGKFLEAQAQYTANMQLFNIFSQQVSTSIKTIGEALAAISRKQ